MQTVSLLLTCHSSLVLLACTIQCFSCISNHGEQIQDRMCWRLGFQWDTDDFGKWATFMIEFFNVKLKAVKLEGVWKTWKIWWLIFPRRLLAPIPMWSAVVLILWWTFPAFLPHFPGEWVEQSLSWQAKFKKTICNTGA